MKSQLELWSLTLEELGSRCSVSTAMDMKTVHRRYEHEGDRFFTITLPAFGKEFERALSAGRIPTVGFEGWKRRSSFSKSLNSDLLSHLEPAGKTPRFLGGFLDRVFDASNGVLFDAYPGLYDPGCIESVYAVRQLTLMFGKLKVLPDDEQISSAFKAFVETDRQVAEHAKSLTEAGKISLLVEDLKPMLNAVFGQSLSAMEKFIYEGDVLPKHGPGATADRLIGNEKYDQRTWTDRLESLFPYMEYAISNHRYHDVQQGVTWHSPEQELPVRMIAVPKTAREPRIIGAEPVCMQYMQQAVGSIWTTLLEATSLPRERGLNYSSVFVGFSQQWPNQVMAQRGSKDGSLATLDLSEASDRVPNWLVTSLFKDYPWFSEAIQVVRSSRADVPGFGVIQLQKYASMGSALTFPIEAVVFATIALTAIRKSVSTSFSSNTSFLESLKGMVRVYGDDIVVPTDYAEPVIDALEAFGFRVNRSKSFWTGKFRESCGKEYYDGSDISIVRYRQSIPSRQELATSAWVSQIQATVSTRNQLYKAGLWKTAGVLDDVLDTVLEGWYPFVGENSPVLGRFSFVYGYDVTGTTLGTQAPFVKGFVPVVKLPRNSAVGQAALLKCLLSGKPEEACLDGLFPETTDKEHLTRSGRPRAVGMKLVKASPF